MAFSFFLLLTVKFLAAQPPACDSINKRSEDGKKNGWQVEYLDREWNKVSKEKSYYYRYDYYVLNGRSNILVEPLYTGCAVKTDSGATLNDTTMGKPVPLNGTYRWYYKNGALQGEETYRDGVRVGTAKNYQAKLSRKKTWLYEEVNYDKRYQHLPFTYYYKLYNEDGAVKFEGYFRFGEEGFALYEELQTN